MHEKTFEIEYIDYNDESHDVSFELSKDAEELLFRGIADRLYDDAEDGQLHGQTVHLYKRLADQRQSHPPWIDVDGPRVYDLELSKSDYGALSSMIGSRMSMIMSPEASDAHRELLRVWDDLTEQMVTDEDPSHGNAVLDDFIDPPQSDNGDFVGYRAGEGGIDIAVFENDTGDRWYTCSNCGVTRPGSGAHHDCNE